uniref:Uncharacterized protein n=1 Tax=Anguilla anguilla TaxID=7936 RepID=A0A0E9RM59_ANGAN
MEFNTEEPIPMSIWAFQTWGKEQ